MANVYAQAADGANLPARADRQADKTAHYLTGGQKAFIARNGDAMKKLGLASENGEVSRTIAAFIDKPGAEQSIRNLTDPAKKAALTTRGFLDGDGKVTNSARSIMKTPTLFAVLYGDRALKDLKLLGLAE
ncbi:hypothetical protein FJU08_14680 [Martelella alba]|uniref:Uncharacterized protein n=2 Tax=Martelella alba TaxID=2590451 RepID=A0A506UBC5_9HYPH|nr:hypothetical protein FJU08_14680 [Martelella alba]